MNCLKLTIIGNSVGLRIRPTKIFPNNLTYSQHVEKLISKINKIPLVRNMSFSRALISEVLLEKEKYARTFPDYFIINIGVCDASNRAIPLWIANIIKRKKIPILTSLFSNIYSNLIKPNISFWVNLRRKRPWISLEKFQRDYEKLIQYLLKETNAKIVLIPINPTTERIENKIPGSRENFIKYNKLIAEISNQYNLNLIDINELRPKVHCPDGIHFSESGHQVVAEKIINFIVSDYKKYD